MVNDGFINLLKLEIYCLALKTEEHIFDKFLIVVLSKDNRHLDNCLKKKLALVLKPLNAIYEQSY